MLNGMSKKFHLRGKEKSSSIQFRCFIRCFQSGLHINTDNEPSIQLAKSAGFQYECTRKAFSYEDDWWKDFLIYYQNKEDWENNNDKFN